MDPADHPAYGGHDDDHEPGRASGEYKVADVTPLRPAGDIKNVLGQMGQVLNEKQTIYGTSSERKNITPLRKLNQ